MTRHEAAVVSAYTGYMLGKFEDLQAYAEMLLGHSVWTQDFASTSFIAELKEAAQKDFVELVVE